MRIKSLLVLFLVFALFQSTLLARPLSGLPWKIQEDGEHTLTYFKLENRTSISFTFDAGDNTFAIVFMGQELFKILNILDFYDPADGLMQKAKLVAQLLNLPATSLPIQTFPSPSEEIEDAFSLVFNMTQLEEIIDLLRVNLRSGHFFSNFTPEMILQAQNFALPSNPLFIGLKAIGFHNLP